VTTLSSNSSAIQIKWKLIANQYLPNARISINNFMNPSLDFKESLVPGVLEWQNPWDRPTNVDNENGWVTVESSSEGLQGNIAVILDEKNGVLSVIEFNEIPDFLSIGALTNRFIDALRIRYDFGNLTEGANREVTFSVLSYAFQDQIIERLMWSKIVEQYDSKIILPVKQRDYLTHIYEHNIKFVAIDNQQVISNKEAKPALDRIYDNGRAIIFTTKID
jgi:hypothetical protein